MKTCREPCAMFKQMEITEQVYEVKTPSKKILGQMPTVTVMSRIEREDNLTLLPTLRRAVLKIARQII